MAVLKCVYRRVPAFVNDKQAHDKKIPSQSEKGFFYVTYGVDVEVGGAVVDVAAGAAPVFVDADAPPMVIWT